MDGSMWILTRKEIMSKNRIKKMTKNSSLIRADSHAKSEKPDFINKLEFEKKKLFPNDKCPLPKFGNKLNVSNRKP